MGYRIAAAPLVLLALMLMSGSAWAQLCRADQTDGTPRPIPRSLAPAVIAAFGVHMNADEVMRTGVMRCEQGRVMACLTGANLNCGRAVVSRVNPGAVAWCREHGDADVVPAYVTGHETIYAWRCHGGHAVVAGHPMHADPYGFVAENWRPVGG